MVFCCHSVWRCWLWTIASMHLLPWERTTPRDDMLFGKLCATTTLELAYDDETDAFKLAEKVLKFSRENQQ